MQKSRLSFARNTKRLTSLVKKLHSGEVPPLTDDEVERISRYFHLNGIHSDIAYLLWQAASASEYRRDLISIAREAIPQPGMDIMTARFGAPLRYLLIQASADVRQQLIDQFTDSGPITARLAVAESLIEAGQVAVGLRRMIDVIPLLCFDHATYMSICIWLTEAGTEELKNALIKEANEARQTGNDELCELLIWGASMIAG